MNAMTPTSRAAILLAFVLAAAGCATVGEKRFACPGRPPGVHCMSASEVYAATQNTDVVAPTAPHATGSDPRGAARGAGAHPERGQPSRNPTPTQAPHPHSGLPDARADMMDVRGELPLPAIDKPIPIRTPAQVMRVWFAPWKNARGVLHGGEYVFIEVEPSRWAMGETSMTDEPVRFFSIQTVDMKESVGKARSEASARPGPSERPKRNVTLPKEPSHENLQPEHRP